MASGPSRPLLRDLRNSTSATPTKAPRNVAISTIRLFRFDRARQVDIRRVDQAHVAHRTGANNVQLLGFVQQLRIDLRSHFHIAGQVEQLLLRRRQVADLAFQRFLLLGQFTDLRHQGAIRRMLFGELAIHFRLLHFSSEIRVSSATD
jgi:hypothetical protein